MKKPAEEEHEGAEAILGGMAILALAGLLTALWLGVFWIWKHV